MTRHRRSPLVLVALTGLLLVTPATGGEVVISDNPEGFRIQMLEFLEALEQQLLRAREYPAFRESFDRGFGDDWTRSVPDEAFDAIWDLDTENLEMMRQTIALIPEFLDMPVNLGRALDALPAAEDLPLQRQLLPCENNAEEFANVKRLTIATNVLKGISNALGIAGGIAEATSDTMDAASGECEIAGTGIGVCVCIAVPTSWIQSTAVIVKGVLEVVQLAIALELDVLEYLIVASQQCLDACGTNDADVEGLPSQQPGLYWRKGCDNRDNDCNREIDDPGEDMFPPVVTVDASLSGRCFRDDIVARAAAALAVKASDDCSVVVAEPADPVSIANCLAVVSTSATDAAGNTSSANATFYVDGVPPLIGPLSVAPGTCFGTLEAAAAELSKTDVADCTATTTTIRADEKECVADFLLEAVDRCENVSRARVSVRIDDTPPDVRIDVLSLPSVDGLACFEATDTAVATVTEATTIDDDCSDRAGRSTTTTTSGDPCNLEITLEATDECALSSSDSLVVRVDDQPPAVGCWVLQERLWPADNALHDVGLSIATSDNCDGSSPRIDVAVTSDEPTELAWNSTNVGDPHPDAVIERDPDGGYRVQVRAQRRALVPDAVNDGRVYRIRVTATDSCGLSSYTDCFVQVPLEVTPMSGVGRAVNSGQIFDATRVN